MQFERLPDYLTNLEFKILSIDFPHLNTLLLLDNYHKDSFDRLLIAQAIAEDMTIIFADNHFSAYPVKLLW